jgi:hypothetical protein
MAERYIPEHRRTQFKAKNQFRPDELRRRREEQQIEIRKQKREEGLAKRRGIVTRDGGIGVGGSMAAATESDDEASAIESEVSSLACSTFLLPPCLFPRSLDFALDDSSLFGDYHRISSPAPRWSLSFYTTFVCMMRSSTWNFFHRPVAMGPTPPTRAITTHDPTTPVGTKANDGFYS